MKYLLDTNLIVLYSRENAISESVEKHFNLFNGHHDLAVSSVVLGELDALSKKLQHGRKRRQRILKYTDELFTIDINTKKIIEKYGDIDAYSQGKLRNNSLGTSARNMGNPEFSGGLQQPQVFTT